MHTLSIFRRTNSVGRTCSAIFLLIAALPASGAFTLFSNFDAGYVQGPLNGQNGWSVQNGDTNTAVVQDPTNPLNQVGSFVNGAGSVNIGRALPGGGLVNGSTGTLFFRLNAAAMVNFNIGASDVAPANFSNDFTNFESQIRLSGVNASEIDVRNGAAFTTGTGSNTTTYTPDTWFNVWMVIHNDTDTTQFYVSGNASGAPTAPFAQGTFRNGVAGNPLITFYSRTSTATPVLVDDIYFDPAGANLLNPIPEPSCAALATLGVATLLKRRPTRAVAPH
jgi:hypothetical protein